MRAPVDPYSFLMLREPARGALQSVRVGSWRSLPHRVPRFQQWPTDTLSSDASAQRAPAPKAVIIERQVPDTGRVSVQATCDALTGMYAQMQSYPQG